MSRTASDSTAVDACPDYHSVATTCQWHVAEPQECVTRAPGATMADPADSSVSETSSMPRVDSVASSTGSVGSAPASYWDNIPDICMLEGDVMMQMTNVAMHKYGSPPYKVLCDNEFCMHGP